MGKSGWIYVAQLKTNFCLLNSCLCHGFTYFLHSIEGVKGGEKKFLCLFVYFYSNLVFLKRIKQVLHFEVGV